MLPTKEERGILHKQAIQIKQEKMSKIFNQYKNSLDVNIK